MRCDISSYPLEASPRGRYVRKEKGLSPLDDREFDRLWEQIGRSIQNG